jgi:SAM-dependent methyltransferase
MRKDDVVLKALTHRTPLRSVLARKFIKHFGLFSYEQRLSIEAVDRPNYGYCIFQAARLASLLRYPRISVLEFGCGGGNGLLNAEKHIKEVTKLFSVDIDLYGFDAGSGLPAPTDYRDMPHYFRQGLHAMDRNALERRLKHAKLVIGDIRDTCVTFLQSYKPAPIGCVLHDLDYYSSTRDALALLDGDAAYFLPRVFMYFDDVVGDDTWLCNEFTGELLAIDEFNQKHRLKKICKNRIVSKQYPNSWWPDLVYVYHHFEHPRYNDFVADQQQLGHQRAIRLKVA